MTSTIVLSVFDLSVASLLVIAMATCAHAMRLGIGSQLIIAGVRTTVQLLLVGLILKLLFAREQLAWTLLVAVVMLAVAGREVVVRQTRRFIGPWNYGIGAAAMCISGFGTTCFALSVIVRPEPWFTPQYAIPLLGMLLGNTMTSVSLGLDRLTDASYRRRNVVETRLALGDEWFIAISEIRRDAIRVALMPMINAMAAAGVVSLPGMMTGQILAGAPPIDAVKYQILIMFLIAGSTGGGAILAVTVGARRLFDHRQRLRLDRVRSP